ncbi:unnamed protein product, partial [Rotaria sp. Silwood1]
VNLEPYQLVWCDANANNLTDLETTVTLKRLQKIIDYVKLLDTVSACEHCLEQTKGAITFLVCAETIGETLIPKIHQLKKCLVNLHLLSYLRSLRRMIQKLPKGKLEQLLM